MWLPLSFQHNVFLNLPEVQEFWLRVLRRVPGAASHVRVPRDCCCQIPQRHPVLSLHRPHIA